MTNDIKIGDTVKLISKPDGNTSRYEPLTVGRTYLCKGFDGSNIITTSDEPGHHAFYWRGRVEKVKAPAP